MLRVALFNMLKRRVEGSVVLDLFAGTGVLAFEALSRGAKSAVLVENNQKALLYLKKNIANLGLADSTKVIKRDVFTVLGALELLVTKFDICFVDPPFALLRNATTEERLGDFLEELHLTSGLMAEDGITVVRYPKGDLFRRRLKAFQILRQRRYGSMEIAILARNGVEIILGTKHPFDRKAKGN